MQVLILRKLKFLHQMSAIHLLLMTPMEMVYAVHMALALTLSQMTQEIQLFPEVNLVVLILQLLGWVKH